MIWVLIFIISLKTIGGKDLMTTTGYVGSFKTKQACETDKYWEEHKAQSPEDLQIPTYFCVQIEKKVWKSR